MQAKIDFEFGGVKYFVDASIVDDKPPFVEEVYSVEIKTPSGEYMLADVDIEKFVETFQDTLDDAADEYLKGLAMAYAEMRADMRREEEVFK